MWKYIFCERNGKSHSFESFFVRWLQNTVKSFIKEDFQVLSIELLTVFCFRVFKKSYAYLYRIHPFLMVHLPGKVQGGMVLVVYIIVYRDPTQRVWFVWFVWFFNLGIFFTPTLLCLMGRFQFMGYSLQIIVHRDPIQKVKYTLI